MPKAGGEVVFGSHDNRTQYGGKGLVEPVRIALRERHPKSYQLNSINLWFQCLDWLGPRPIVMLR